MKNLLLSAAIALTALTTTAQTKDVDILTAKSMAPHEKYFKLNMSINMETNDTMRYMEFQNLKYSSIVDLGLFHFKDYNHLNKLFILMEKAMDDGENITYNFGAHKVSDLKGRENLAFFSLGTGEYTLISRRQINEVRVALGLSGNTTTKPTLIITTEQSDIPIGYDILTTKDGTETKVHVLEVGLKEIKYKRDDNQDGPTITISKADIFMIKYKNGTKEMFKTTTTDTQSMSESAKLRLQGKEDAKTNYPSKNTGAGGTAVTNILLSPLFGLIPAGIASSKPPKDHNLKYPNPTLMENSSYKAGYVEEAHRKKRSKIWSSYAISGLIWLFVIVVSQG